MMQGERGFGMLIRIRPSGISSTVATGSSQVMPVPDQAAIYAGSRNGLGAVGGATHSAGAKATSSNAAQ